jgi:hypothetical protein
MAQIVPLGGGGLPLSVLAHPLLRYGDSVIMLRDGSLMCRVSQRGERLSACLPACRILHKDGDSVGGFRRIPRGSGGCYPAHFGSPIRCCAKMLIGKAEKQPAAGAMAHRVRIVRPAAIAKICALFIVCPPYV